MSLRVGIFRKRVWLPGNSMIVISPQLLLVLFLSALAVLSTGRSHAATIHVGPQMGNHALRSSIENAADGDTILLSHGNYFESSLTITKSIALLGTGWPVIRSVGDGNILRVRATNVSIRGLHLIGAPLNYLRENAAILIDSSQNIQVVGNQCDSNYFGVYVSFSSHCMIDSNIMTGVERELSRAGNGIHLWSSREIVIRNNLVSGHRDGIYFEFAKQCTISDNQSNHNLRYGLHFMYSDSSTYTANTFDANGSGVAVMFTREVHMSGNTFSNSWGGAAYGLLLKDIKDSRVVGNTIHGNTVGIWMEGTDRAMIQGNRIHNNGWAMKIMASCNDNQIISNNFTDNSFLVATNSRYSGSTFQKNYWSQYTGFDLDRNGFGDQPFRPVSLYALMVESEPAAMVLTHSLFIDALDLAERMIPSLTPVSLIDELPKMRPHL